MHSSKPLTLLLGLGAIVNIAAWDTGCSGLSVPTVYVTVPGDSITETVYAFSQGTLTGDAAVTSSLVSAQVIEVLPASAELGPYSFTEDNGTTSWLGGHTPPTSVNLITRTSVITLQPLSTIISLEGSAVTGTTYLEVPPNATTTPNSTQGSTPYIPSLSAPVFGNPGSSLVGWNASLTTFLKLTVAPIASPLFVPTTEELVTSTSTTSLPALNYVTPTAYGKLAHRVKARQVGGIVEATIDGVAVSWTNDFDGSTQTASDTEPSFVPVTATAPSFGGIAPSSSSHSNLGHPPATPSLPANISVTSSPLEVTSSPSASITSSTTTDGTSNLTPTLICDETQSGFYIDFDDLPTFSAGPDDTDIPPIFNPYRKLYWEGRFGYVATPLYYFPPHSPPQVAVYRANGTNANASNDAGLERSGEFGAGPRAENNAYWFNAFRFYIGCIYNGPEDCWVTINGYVYGKDEPTATALLVSPPCGGAVDCVFAGMILDETFRNLVSLQITAVLGEFGTTPVSYYLDDVKLEWSNNSCAAQQVRASST